MTPKELLRAIRRRMVPGDGVVDRTVTGGIWVAFSNVADRVLQLATVLFLARLLSPAAFGLFGIALVTQSALKRLTKLGLDTALVRHQDDDVDRYLDTVWTVELCRGMLVGGALYLAAPLVGSFFGEPRVVPMLEVFALLPVMGGLRNPGVVYFVKELDFGRDVAYKLASRVTYAVVGVGVGVATRSVWALVAAMVASRAASLVLSYAIHSYRPRPRFDRAAAAELFDYGKWIFGSESLMFLINEGDDAFVGWALGSSALGVYQLSFQLANTPATEITQPIQRVVFPAYSKLRGDTESLRRGYFTSVRLIALLSVPASVGIVLVAPLFVPAVLGPAWSGAVLPMQLFGAYGAFRSVRSATVPLFRAIDRPDYDTKIRVLKLLLLAPFVYPASQAFGTAGVALVVFGHAVVVAPVASYVAVRSVDGTPTAFLSLLGYPVLGSAAMAAVVYALRERIAGFGPAVELIALVAAGVAVYAGVMLGFERRRGIGLERLYRLVRNET